MGSQGRRMTTEQYQIGYEAGYSDGVDEAALQAAQPDCRTCNNYRMGYCHSWANYPISSDSNCTNGDKYQKAPPVVLWRTK